ncbi:hypothetical protein A3C23_01255 [Candidatus Roizmanbacteria bacterium RIFCSPHIGHO2_02_FULL_37_13b]|uniref:Uncharacterized protein n=1 Tax=Candidatus Roizmanbacteria bacterium RIFCSPLOWO2_02_FULL_36_11 TaxID=1802071 RepID=A0A1F7JHE4_9BACT|nr:MAG: hypothetical protein A3C23_01255 [Candidatus Roizmanbacteria bacterium RIFCSPHIGHO2_02_FULL_37_13b]OGK55033.1 MAG: hypothetical protein A3H78_00980 [Candidatus Roizmanbacteria bacterium RIFCSPLOWO2_02_FULL_36_11]
MTIPAVWAKPGEDMDAEFTRGIVSLYDLCLRRTDTERTEDARLNALYQNEPVRPEMTDEEKRRVYLELQLALEQAQVAEQKKAEEDVKKRLEKQMDNQMAA